MKQERTLRGYCRSPIGLLEVTGTENAVLSVIFVEEASEADDQEISSPAVRTCLRQLDEYFRGERIAFDIPLKKAGTPFQQEVWSQVESVAYGEMATYRDIAAGVSREKAVRAVGSANGKNRFAIVVPCHRVVGSDGSMHGYAWGVWRKEWLLQQEAQKITKQAVELK